MKHKPPTFLESKFWENDQGRAPAAVPIVVAGARPKPCPCHCVYHCCGALLGTMACGGGGGAGGAKPPTGPGSTTDAAQVSEKAQAGFNTAMESFVAHDSDLMPLSQLKFRMM